MKTSQPCICGAREQGGKLSITMKKYEYKLTFAGRRIVKKTIEAATMREALHTACVEADTHGSRCLGVYVEKLP